MARFEEGATLMQLLRDYVIDERDEIMENDIRLIAPVFVGDTIYAESEVLSKRESAKRPTQGIVTVETRGTNQDGVEVMSFERTMLVHRRGHSPEDAANY